MQAFAPSLLSLFGESYRRRIRTSSMHIISMLFRQGPCQRVDHIFKGHQEYWQKGDNTGSDLIRHIESPRGESKDYIELLVEVKLAAVYYIFMEMQILDICSQGTEIMSYAV